MSDPPPSTLWFDVVLQGTPLSPLTDHVVCVPLPSEKLHFWVAQLEREPQHDIHVYLLRFSNERYLNIKTTKSVNSET